MTRPTLPSLALALVLLPSITHATWQFDGTRLSNPAYSGWFPTIVSDGAGGAIVTWHDSRNGTWDIYAQRLNPSGVAQWTADGVPLCVAANHQFYTTITSDGAGGAIVSWYDLRNPATDQDIYVQRVNASGVVQWAANGVALCTALNTQADPEIVSDGSGGAIVMWYDDRSGSDIDIYAQRINATGVVQWTADGVGLCTAVNDQFAPTIASDGSGGAIVTWSDFRSGTNVDIYAQRINASGTVQWTSDGVALCTAAFGQADPTIASDGSGGAIVTWSDQRSGFSHIYAQRINASGTAQWTNDGVPICTAVNGQDKPTIVSDGSGGAVVAWNDARNGIDDIYAQRINASGVAQWTADGVALCTAAQEQAYQTIASDGSGGAIVTWEDSRSDGVYYDAYVQRVNASGAVQWTTDGVALCAAAQDQLYPILASDGVGNAIVTWFDFRDGINGGDVYAQRIEGTYGQWGHPEPLLSSVADIPADQGGHVLLRWTASDLDVRPQQAISHYTIWRQLAAAAANATEGPASTESMFIDPATIGPDFAGPAYRRGALVDASTAWEFIATVPARYATEYGFNTPTLSDSIDGDSADETYQVLAHTTNAFVFFESNLLTGHSVDNLAPAAPLLLAAQRVGANVQLTWNRVAVADLRDYSVYRSTSTGVTPVPSNFLASAEDSVLVDASAPATALYYIVTAFDVHENQSAPSNEASVGATTDVGNTPPITALTVLQNHPNPFAETTELEIGLPSNSEFSIDVYDVAGRKVRATTLAGRAAGWQRVAFDGRSDSGQPLPSGVYFYRVTANGATITKRMVILH